MKRYRYGEPIDPIHEKSKVPHNSTREILGSVRNKQVNFGMVDLGILKYHVKRNREKYANIKGLENLCITQSLYVVFNGFSLRDEFNKYLRLYGQKLYSIYSKKYL